MLHLVRVFAFGGVLAVIAALAAPGDVIAQKKKDKGKVDNGYAALPEDYKAIQNKKDLTGEIVSVSGLVVTLRTDNAQVQPNPKYKPGAGASNSQQYRLWQDGQRLQTDYQRALNSKNLAERNRLMNKYYVDYARYQNDMAKINQQLLSKANK